MCFLLITADGIARNPSVQPVRRVVQRPDRIPQRVRLDFLLDALSLKPLQDPKVNIDVVSVLEKGLYSKHPVNCYLHNKHMKNN